MNKKILAIHQPDFLPYSGFFYKLAKCDKFLIGDYYNYSNNGYIQRVKLGGEWLTELVIDKKKITLDTPISEIEVDAGVTYQRIMSAIDKHLKTAPYYKRVRRTIKEWGDLYGHGFARLSDLNMSLFYMIGNEIGIDVQSKICWLPIDKPETTKGQCIVDIMQNVEPFKDMAYLSGAGGKSYIGSEFEDAGIELLYSNHRAKYSGSILEVIAYEADPLSVVLLEEI